ncbi:MAG: hypothetical protein K6L74_05765 [Neptuniibacter sp.]
MPGTDEVQLEKLLQQLQQLKSELDQELDTLHHSDADDLRGGDSKSIAPLNHAPSESIESCQERIRQVEEALNRIDMDIAGYCEQCGAPITGKKDHGLSNPDVKLCNICASK